MELWVQCLALDKQLKREERLCPRSHCQQQSWGFCGAQESCIFTTTSDTFSSDGELPPPLPLQLISTCFRERVWATGFWWESEGKGVGTQAHRCNPNLGKEGFTLENSNI